LLQWLLAGPELDLYFTAPADHDAIAASNALDTRIEFIRMTLPAGSYDVVASGANSGPTPFELWVWFDEPADPAEDLPWSAERIIE
jgi:hypothetical protein